MVLSLPMDTYPSLLQAWLANVQARLSDGQRVHLAVFALRAGGQHAARLGQHLQTCAGPQQLVYRVSSHRWLILELQNKNDDRCLVLERAKQVASGEQVDDRTWFSQAIFRTGPLNLAALVGEQAQPAAFQQLVDQLAPILERLVDPSQLLIESWELGTPGELVVGGSMGSRPSQGEATNHHQCTAPAQAAPGAQVVGEIIKQWKLVQAKLANLNSALEAHRG